MTMKENLKYCESPAYAPDYFRTVAGIDKLNFQVKILYGDYIKFYNKNLLNGNNLVNDRDLEFISQNKQYTIFRLNISSNSKGSARHGTPPDYFGFIKFKNLNLDDNLDFIAIEINAVILKFYTVMQIKEFIQEKIESYGFEYIHDKISRLDVNIYLLGFDFSTLNDEYFLVPSKESNQRKNNFIPNTFYFGSRSSNTVQLKIYNKWKELKDTKQELKQDLLIQKFKALGIDDPLAYPLWNIEFEIRREKLKQYSISNLTNVDKCVNALFNDLMKRFRMLEKPTPITDNNRNRVKNHFIWDYLVSNYDYNSLNAEDINYIKAKKYKKDFNWLQNRIKEFLEENREEQYYYKADFLSSEYLEKLKDLLNAS